MIFDWEMAIDPFWDCPNMKIVDGRTGKIVEQILGGIREDSKYWKLIFWKSSPRIG